MGRKRKLAGIWLLLLLLIAIRGLHRGNPITVVYATADGRNVSIERPLPPYAHHKNGFLMVEISGDSPLYPGSGRGLGTNGTYVFEGVFLIENNESETGYGEVCVRVSSDSRGIGFFTGPFEGTWDDVIEVTLGADESAEIGMRVNTTGLERGDHWDEITIEAWGGNCG